MSSSASAATDPVAAVAAPAWGFRHESDAGRVLARLTVAIEWLSGAVLAIDVLLVFLSVIYRYALHDPVDWAEEIARALMIVLVFFGAATVLARSQHVGVDVFQRRLPAAWQPVLIQLAHWIIAAVAASLAVSALLLLIDSWTQRTSLGLPQWIYVLPVLIGSTLMALFGVANALQGPRHAVITSLLLAVAIAWPVCAWNLALPQRPVPHGALLGIAFVAGLWLGVPIGFVLAFASLVYFLSDPSLPMLVYAQQVMAGSDHFVLLAIPFFVLAGLLMEANGMSARLIELLLRILGRLRGSMGLITISATAFFSGVSGSKLADVAAVGGIVMPAVRRTRQDPNEAAGLLASTAVMAETIPPCINMIILGFVANISIGGLFIAGLVPATVLAAALAAVSIYFGEKIDPRQAFEQQRPLQRLIGGAAVGLIMVLMIGKGVTSGVATSTEVSAFAVVYALIVGGLAFRELTLRSV